MPSKSVWHKAMDASELEITQARIIAHEIQQFLGPVSSESAAWRHQPEIPTTVEIMKPQHLINPELLQTQVWHSREEYLKAKYTLLREDGCWPLRQCVSELRQQPFLMEKDSHTNANIYESVYFSGATLSHKGLAFKVELSTFRAEPRIRWRQSKRLKTGTVVALSPIKDCFQLTCVVAVVMARPLRDLEVSLPQKPTVYLELADAHNADFDPQVEWVMVEAGTGYWEAYRHTLSALQKMPSEPFPFSQHVCRNEPEAAAPLYREKLGPAVLVKRSDLEDLDHSQQAALHRILNKSLALVQGPPGTGKTYLSVKAIKKLLDVFKGDEAPIIVASQTNHALDQLLNQIAKFEPRFVRLGNQAEDEAILRHTISKLRDGRAKQHAALKEELGAIQKQLVAQLKEAINAISGNTPMHPSLFYKHKLISKPFLDSFARLRQKWIGYTVSQNSGPVELWCPSVTRFDKDRTPLRVQAWREEYEDMLSEPRHDELDLEIDVDEDKWEILRGFHVNFDPGFVASDGQTCTAKQAEHLLKLYKDADSIPTRYRPALYNYWQKEIKQQVTRDLHLLNAACRQFAVNRKASTMQTDHALIKRHHIIGATLTGLSKYRALLMSLKPKVVLIEEAAEALEPLSVVACMPSVEHLILVGDHLQLRGRVNCRNLANMPYNFNFSLFERLVTGGMEKAVLNVQRRMRPELRQLLNPIYPRLKDHAIVSTRPGVRGMFCNLVFYEHFHSDSVDNALSYRNEGEAREIVLLVQYLVENGYNADNITILSFYSAQKRLLTSRLRANPVTQALRHSVQTVDSFQGEESDIIILSLVRNNTLGNIGFLEDQNRVTVALSRARSGLIIFGNRRSLAQSNYLWKQALYIMEKNRLIFNYIPLLCTNHNHKMKGQAEIDMSKLNGGCGRSCEAKLECGHICKRLCHPLPHSTYVCEQLCQKILSCRHQCRNQCWSQKHECSICSSPRRSIGSTTMEFSGAEAFQAFANGGGHKADLQLAEESQQRAAQELEEAAQKQAQKMKVAEIPNLIDLDPDEEMPTRASPKKGRQVWTEKWTSAALDKRVEEIQKQQAIGAQEVRACREGNLVDLLA